MRVFAATLIGMTVAVGALGSWFYAAPAPESGWLLLVAALGSLSLFTTIQRSDLAVFAGLVITSTSAVVWYQTRTITNSGWVMAICVLGGLATVLGINRMIDRQTQSEDANSRQTRRKKQTEPQG